jgi:hypothetical protein
MARSGRKIPTQQVMPVAVQDATDRLRSVGRVAWTARIIGRRIANPMIMTSAAGSGLARSHAGTPKKVPSFSLIVRLRLFCFQATTLRNRRRSSGAGVPGGTFGATLVVHPLREIAVRIVEQRCTLSHGSISSQLPTRVSAAKPLRPSPSFTSKPLSQKQETEKLISLS